LRCPRLPATLGRRGEGEGGRLSPIERWPLGPKQRGGQEWRRASHWAEGKGLAGLLLGPGRGKEVIFFIYFILFIYFQTIFKSV